VRVTTPPDLPEVVDLTWELIERLNLLEDNTDLGERERLPREI
jgi:hypothetical protein